MPFYRAAKIDANQPEIIRALRAVGAVVQPLSDVGKGCPDLLVGWKGANYLIEVKDSTHKRNQVEGADKRLTPDQVDWHRLWKGQVAVVTNTAEALAVIGVSVLL